MDAESTRGLPLFIPATPGVGSPTRRCKACWAGQESPLGPCRLLRACTTQLCHSHHRKYENTSPIPKRRPQRRVLSGPRAPLRGLSPWQPQFSRSRPAPERLHTCIRRTQAAAVRAAPCRSPSTRPAPALLSGAATVPRPRLEASRSHEAPRGGTSPAVEPLVKMQSAVGGREGPGILHV